MMIRSRIEILIKAARKLSDQNYRNAITSGASNVEILNQINDVKENNQNKRFEKAREENKKGLIEDFGGGEYTI